MFGGSLTYRPSRWRVPNSHVRYSASVHIRMQNQVDGNRIPALMDVAKKSCGSVKLGSKHSVLKRQKNEYDSILFIE
ncbi:hypothetical protein DICVIV_11686 [Dictyocaulus viviparus]|uniref:Uncharacterized protein n=1 Tax=Dictyocaulus viviparus TaxID=29172 RepID=A0A0D8XCJ0_DICVI|nr:hypothetical protein DICVIV_11686 [Dictyocaulus viviparus]